MAHEPHTERWHVPVSSTYNEPVYTHADVRENETTGHDERNEMFHEDAFDHHGPDVEEKETDAHGCEK